MALRGVETIEDAERLRNKVLFINRSDAHLPEGRYFIDDLIGCTVYDADSGKSYGTVSDVSKTGANDVWHIASEGKEYLLPAIDEVVISVAPEKGEVVIRPMKGIFDDED